MTVVARQVDTTAPAGVLLVPLTCGACGGDHLHQRDQANGGTRRTWTGRCDCGAETVIVVDAVTIHPGGRSYEA